MKKNNSAKRGPQDASQLPVQPDKIGWIRKFCGKGIFREIWKNRFVILKGDQLYISEKEASDERKAQEVVDLSDYERCEELRKAKSRSKKNHSRFTLLRCRTPGNTVSNLVFLAVSPEEKELWISALNAALTRAKNRILDEVTVEDENHLSHLTRDRAKIPHNRRLPTRGHLMAVASSSDGMLTLDLIQEEDASSSLVQEACHNNFRVNMDKPASNPDCPRSKTDSALSALVAPPAEAAGKSHSLPRETAVAWETEGARLTPAEKSRCASMDQILSPSPLTPTAPPPSPATPVSQLQELIGQKLERTQQLLNEVRGAEPGEKGRGKGRGSPEAAEAERLLKEAVTTWGHAQEVLVEVKELRELYLQLDPASSATTGPSSLSPANQALSRQNIM
ncbi:LOW QUALITY PROTEIN: pleckstrin homology domain-containing family O member 1b [Aplochiton taeniatus]